jgi:hypothetical protein
VYDVVMTEESAEQKLKRYEYVLDAQADEIDKLRAEVARLTEGADAHTVLQSLYRNRELPESLRAKAASAALPTERPRLMSTVPSMEQDRRERWRAYQRYELKKQILVETHQLPGPGWDAKLVDDTYQPPEGDAEPPMDLYGRDAIKAHVALSEILDAAERRKRNGNGGDDSND